MHRTTRIFTILVLVAVFSAGGGGPNAEVAATGDGGVIILGITEGPDPIPQIWWDPVRDDDCECILNPDGGERGDGRPDVALDPTTGWPHVTWAYHNGIDYDIAYSKWTGEEWSEIEFLTSSAKDEIDPRIFVNNNAVYIVWWEDDPQTTWLRRRPNLLDDWEVPEKIDDKHGGGRRPSVVTWQGSVVIASEDDGPQSGLQILIAEGQPQSKYTAEPVISAPNAQDFLDVILHVAQGRLWMDWKHSESYFAYSEQVDGSWQAPTLVPWEGGSWVEEEAMRLTIRNMVLSD